MNFLHLLNFNYIRVIERDELTTSQQYKLASQIRKYLKSFVIFYAHKILKIKKEFTFSRRLESDKYKLNPKGTGRVAPQALSSVSRFYTPYSL